MAKIKVMIVDDSAVVRKVIGGIIERAPGMELQAAAADPIFAIGYMEKEWPDVIILDIEMPRMDGVTFLRKIMSERPTPVVVCSTLTEAGADTTMQAMSAGAVEIITKPKMGLKGFLEDSEKALIHSIRAAAGANVQRLKAVSVPLKVNAKHDASVVLDAHVSRGAMARTTERIIAIGTSTGGTNALEYILTRLPRVCPGIVIVQHMPERFTAAFAARLNSISELEVKEAEDGDTVLPGRALVSPGGKHMMLVRSGAKYVVSVKEGPLVSRHCPSVDVLFRSVANCAGVNAVGFILTGMGDDGANGMKEMHDAGSYTIAQDEKSCVVYGMPHEAVKHGGVDEEMSLESVPVAIMEYGFADGKIKKKAS